MGMGNKRRGGWNSGNLWFVILCSLATVAFFFGTLLGMELARTGTPRGDAEPSESGVLCEFDYW